MGVGMDTDGRGDAARLCDGSAGRLQCRGRGSAAGFQSRLLGERGLRGVASGRGLLFLRNVQRGRARDGHRHRGGSHRRVPEPQQRGAGGRVSGQARGVTELDADRR